MAPTLKVWEPWSLSQVGQKLSPVRPVLVPHYSLDLLSLEMHTGLRVPLLPGVPGQSLPSCQSHSLCLVTPEPQSIPPNPAHHHLGFVPKPGQPRADPPRALGCVFTKNACSHLLPRLPPDPQMALLQIP